MSWFRLLLRVLFGVGEQQQLDAFDERLDAAETELRRRNALLTQAVQSVPSRRHVKRKQSDRRDGIERRRA